MFIRVNSSLKRTSSFTKHVPLSDIIKLGIPLLEINRFRAQINDDTVKIIAINVIKNRLAKTGPNSLHWWFQREEIVLSDMVVAFHWVGIGMVLIQISDIKNTF